MEGEMEEEMEGERVEGQGERESMASRALTLTCAQRLYTVRASPTLTHIIARV